jgi:Uma2 family endonuclease
MPEDDWQYELIDGVLIRMPPNNPDHGETETEFAWHLRTFLDTHRLGTLFTGDPGFILARNPDTVLGPDLAFVRSERLPPKETRGSGFMSIFPDLAIEIVSPSNEPSEIADKVRRYLAAGVPLIWVVHPRRKTVTVHEADQPERTLGEADTLDGGSVLPGFHLALSRPFNP